MCLNDALILTVDSKKKKQLKFKEIFDGHKNIFEQPLQLKMVVYGTRIRMRVLGWGEGVVDPQNSELYEVRVAQDSQTFRKVRRIIFI